MSYMVVARKGEAVLRTTVYSQQAEAVHEQVLLQSMGWNVTVAKVKDEERFSFDPVEENMRSDERAFDNLYLSLKAQGLI